AGLSNDVLPGNGGLDLNYPTLFTTDLVGSAGRNFVFGNSDLSDYRYDNTGFTGTSGATPIISGLVALMLSARPELSYRDVQQALLLSAQHFDREDPLLVQNGAGLEVSLNLGFGVPHAGLAVALAQAWKPRGQAQTTSVVATPNLLIPDDGLRVEVSGEGVPAHLMSIPVTSSLGYQAEDGTSEYSLTNAAEALSEWQGDLSGQAVILRRGLNTFAEKIRNMENANPALIIIRDNTGSSDRMIMAGTQRAYVPAVFMARNAGLELEGLIATNSSVQVRLASIKAVVEFDVTEARVCEHVGLRLQTTHTRRGDLRITLVSPLGTRSALQRPGTDSFAGPVDWTYHTVHSFLEPSGGRWRLEVTDEEPGNTGMITRAELIVRGLPIVDTDRDGLSDPWEMDKFGSLDGRASDDLDRDGHSNALEQLLETDPLTSDSPLRLTIEPWRPGVVRVSWPGYRGDSYRILTSSNPDGPYVPEAVVSGAFPETEWFKIVAPSTRHYLRLERLSP
ncbi:MAG: hypothetical protein FJ405_08810, partial [Verrucomicrobia bacterium]|nr:hypothetical protein [Verrucomicrobiota bacterium]